MAAFSNSEGYPRGGRWDSTKFYTGRLCLEVQPLSLLNVHSYDKWYPFNIPSLEHSIHFYSCKCSLLNMNKPRNHEVILTSTQQ